MRLTYRTSAASAFADSKPHYAILDGLRGVAALTVIWYHVFEGFATSPLDQKFNHGYLAVDFFFILSGFVVGYAYDDRWAGRRAGGGMRMRDFLKRRIVRLHPMVVLGSVLGTDIGRSADEGVQVSRRHLLSRVHHPLPVHVSVLCVDFHRCALLYGMAVGRGRIRRQYRSGVHSSESVRRSFEEVARQPHSVIGAQFPVKVVSVHGCHAVIFAP